MQAQVRTIVAASGERLVVLPEAQYAALVTAAQPQMGQAAAVSSSAQMGQAVTPAQMMAGMPTANTPRMPRKAPKAVARAAAPVTTAPVAAAPAETPRKCSLEDVLLFG